MTPVSTADVAPQADRAFEDRRRTAARIFRGALTFNAALTVFWLVVYTTGSNAIFFGNYEANTQALIRVAQGILFFYIVWGFIWFIVKSLLLKYVVGFSKDERRSAFASRMDKPFDVAALVA